MSEDKKIMLVILGPQYFVGEVDSFNETPEKTVITLKKVFVLQILVEGKEDSLRYSSFGIPFVTETLTFINPSAYTFLSESSPLYSSYRNKTSSIIVPDKQIIQDLGGK